MSHTAENDAATCHYCGPTDKELRPYGPGGSTVCFPCATASPEREQAAKNAFGGLLDAVEVISPGPVMIGTEDGPVPFDPRVIPPAVGNPS
jgi:hypothetical protein